MLLDAEVALHGLESNNQALNGRRGVVRAWLQDKMRFKVGLHSDPDDEGEQTRPVTCPLCSRPAERTKCVAHARTHTCACFA